MAVKTVLFLGLFAVIFGANISHGSVTDEVPDDDKLIYVVFLTNIPTNPKELVKELEKKFKADIFIDKDTLMFAVDPEYELKVSALLNEKKISDFRVIKRDLEDEEKQI